MDYKHRVPGYRPHRHTRRRLPWRLPAAAVALVLILWLIFRDGDETPPPTAAEPAPPPPRTTQLPAPPIPPKSLPEEKKPVKPEARPEKKAEPAVTKVELPPSKPEVAQKPVEPAPVKPEAPAKPVEPPPPKPPEPRFSFYKILPEKEVIIGESDIKSMKQEESLGNKPAGVVYLLQAGSFPNLADAEKLKTQLSQLKVKSKIETVKIENTPWHRVKIGPFGSLVDADRTRAYLRTNQIDSVVQKSTGKP